MKNKIDIQAIRWAEKNYTAMSEISDKIFEFIYNNECDTKKEMEELEEIKLKIDAMQEKLFSKAAKLTNEYLKQNKRMAA